MWYTERSSGYDTPGATKMVSTLAEHFEKRTAVLLRVGLTLVVMAQVAMAITYYSFGGPTTFTFDLFYGESSLFEQDRFWKVLTFFHFLYVMGVLHVATFQAALSDDAGWSRGYRAGSKILAMGATLDLIGNSMQLAIYMYYAENCATQDYKVLLDVAWLAHHLPRALQGLACVAYGWGYFLLEIYHDQGTSNLYAISNLMIFSAAGLSNFLLGPGTRFNGLAFWLQLAANTSALLWALPFEELLMGGAGLHETELVNKVEEEVNQYSRMNPYYGI